MISEVYMEEVVRLPLYVEFREGDYEKSGEELIIARNKREYIIYLRPSERSYKALVFPSLETASETTEIMGEDIERVFKSMGFRVVEKRWRRDIDEHIRRAYPRIKEIFTRYESVVRGGAGEEELSRYSVAIRDIVIAFKGSAVCEVELERVKSEGSEGYQKGRRV